MVAGNKDQEAVIHTQFLLVDTLIDISCQHMVYVNEKITKYCMNALMHYIGLCSISDNDIRVVG